MTIPGGWPPGVGVGYQPAPMNAPPAQPLGIGVQPGQSNIVFAQLVIISGASGGLFLYNGAPGPGNPPVLWAVPPGVTADPYHNPVSAVLGVGTPGGPQTLIDASGDVTLTGTSGNQLSLMPGAALPFALTSALTGVMQTLMSLGSGDVNQTQAGVISGIQLGTGSAAKMGTLITSPYGSAGMGLLLEAENDGSTDTPFGTFGTVSTQGGTLTFQPVLAFLPYALLLYGGTGALTVVTQVGNNSSLVSGTIPIPASVSVGYGESWGPGAGGPNGGGSNAASGGGYGAEPALALTPGGTASYSIPAAGNGAASGSAAQGTSPTGATTLTGSAVTVTGNPGSAGTLAGAPATGGAASGNTIAFKGGDAGQGNTNSGGAGGGSSAGPGGAGHTGGSPNSDNGAAGGTAPSGGAAGGAGGNGTPKSVTVGKAGGNPGAGGGGGGFGSPVGAGGRGGVGQVRLTYQTGAPPILVSLASAAGTDQFGTSYSAGNVFSQQAFAQAPGGTLADTWHNITTVSGMTINGGGHIAYTKKPDNTVAVEVLNVTTNSTADGSTIVTAGNGLPAAYRPLNEKRRTLLYANAKSTVGSYPDAGFAFQTDGSIQCYGFPAATRIDGYMVFPLDA
jgi:hypothetical protein